VPVISKAQDHSTCRSATPDPATAPICCCSRLRGRSRYIRTGTWTATR
jgi:hypothetical protein